MLIGFMWLRIDTAPDTSEHSDEIFDWKNGREFIEHSREEQFLKQASVQLTNKRMTQHALSYL